MSINEDERSPSASFLVSILSPTSVRRDFSRSMLPKIEIHPHHLLLSDRDRFRGRHGRCTFLTLAVIPGTSASDVGAGGNPNDLVFAELLQVPGCEPAAVFFEVRRREAVLLVLNDHGLVAVFGAEEFTIDPGSAIEINILPSEFAGFQLDAAKVQGPAGFPAGVRCFGLGCEEVLSRRQGSKFIIPVAIGLGPCHDPVALVFPGNVERNTGTADGLALIEG